MPELTKGATDPIPLGKVYFASCSIFPLINVREKDKDFYAILWDHDSFMNGMCNAIGSSILAAT